MDPYYGKQEKQPEAEPLDLPDNLNLENGEEDGEDKENEEEGKAVKCLKYIQKYLRLIYP